MKKSIHATFGVAGRGVMRIGSPRGCRRIQRRLRSALRRERMGAGAAGRKVRCRWGADIDPRTMQRVGIAG